MVSDRTIGDKFGQDYTHLLCFHVVVENPHVTGPDLDRTFVLHVDGRTFDVTVWQTACMEVSQR
jgi:hypothetical protein